MKVLRKYVLKSGNFGLTSYVDWDYLGPTLEGRYLDINLGRSHSTVYYRNPLMKPLLHKGRAYRK